MFGLYLIVSGQEEKKNNHKKTEKLPKISTGSKRRRLTETATMDWWRNGEDGGRGDRVSRHINYLSHRRVYSSSLTEYYNPKRIMRFIYLKRGVLTRERLRYVYHALRTNNVCRYNILISLLDFRIACQVEWSSRRLDRE